MIIWPLPDIAKRASWRGRCAAMLSNLLRRTVPSAKPMVIGDGEILAVLPDRGLFHTYIHMSVMTEDGIDPPVISVRLSPRFRSASDDDFRAALVSALRDAADVLGGQWDGGVSL
jgi:hypothetical protein